MVLQASVLYLTMRLIVLCLAVLQNTEACKVIFFSLSTDGSKGTHQKAQVELRVYSLGKRRGQRGHKV